MSETEYDCDDCDADCQEIQRAKCRPAHLCQIRELQSENDDLQAGINCGAARYDKLWNEHVELKAELATADKHIGWLKGAKVRLNKSIKIGDGALDALIDLEKVAAKKLTTAKEKNKRLRDALEKIETAKIANMKPNSVALYQMLIKETAAQALGRKAKENKP